MGLSLWNSIKLFFTEYTFVFIILMVTYSKYFSVFLLILYIILSVILIGSNYGYYKLMTSGEDMESPRTYQVVEIKDSNPIYTNIVTSHILMLLPVIDGTVIGLIIFPIISFFIFILFRNNEIMFFNPMLFLMGYRVYNIRVKEHDKSVYIIYKGKLQEGDFISASYLYENVLISDCKR